MLHGLRVLIRAKDCPHKMRWQAIEMLAKLEAQIAGERIVKMSVKPNKLRKLIEQADEQGLLDAQENEKAA